MTLPVAERDDDGDDAAAALARGLARHASAWALAAGADAAAAQAVAEAAQALCRALDEGHVCLPLERIDGMDGEGTGPAGNRRGPPEAGWAAALRASRIVEDRRTAAPRAPATALPLVLDPQGRLYLQRHFRHEQRLAARLRNAATAVPGLGASALAAGLQAAGTDGLADEQALAVALALRQRLAVISGGPGTGKTTTVVHLLAALLHAEPGLRVALAAPTGKAALRMTEAIGQRATGWPAGLRARLPTAATTVHRLIGLRPDGSVQHHAGQPLPLDVLVVDEASMLDLALATLLLDAVPTQARIVLLGDRHQLAAVEAGAVFAELAAQRGFRPEARAALAAACGRPADALPPAGPGDALADCTIELRHSHRFAGASAIGQLATAVREGQPAAALAVLAAEATAAPRHGATLHWLDDTADDATWRRHLPQALQPYLQAVAAAVQAPRAPGAPCAHAAVHAAFGRVRVLCALRRGPRGVEAVNALLESHARAMLASLGVAVPPAAASPWYPGRAVMVTRNMPSLGLFNGDIGLMLPGPDGELAVVFDTADGRGRWLAPARLPAHESAFAMTVHKAQGSEFDHAIVLLPGAAGRLLTRELLYTAVTRARGQVTLAAGADAITRAVATPTQRDGGLAERLREAG
jgi:exodeoxyribonuclease V alpha subunit